MMTPQDRLDRAALELMPVTLSMSVKQVPGLAGTPPKGKVDPDHAGELAYEFANALMRARERHLLPSETPHKIPVAV